jgi:hypothetical protein
MNFFRLRFINTLLVLLIGIVLGYIMKERAGDRETAPYTAKYPVAAAISPGTTEESIDEGEVQVHEGVSTDITPGGSGQKNTPGTEPAPGPAEPKPVRPANRETATPAADPDESAYQGAAPEPGNKEPAKDKGDDVVRGADDSFFKDPGRFAGRELEMDLQMIMARKTPKGWLINLVRSKSGKNADYLYVEDESVLGEKPDLRIGYFYKTRFICGKGDSASGNKLINLIPTNNKASWATGVSAVE